MAARIENNWSATLDLLDLDDWWLDGGIYAQCSSCQLDLLSDSWGVVWW